MKKFSTFVFDNSDLESFIRKHVKGMKYQISDLIIKGEVEITVQAEAQFTKKTGTGKKEKDQEAANPGTQAPFLKEPATGEIAPPERTTTRSKPERSRD